MDRLYFLVILVVTCSAINASDAELQSYLGKKQILKYNVYNSPPEITTVFSDRIAYTTICIEHQVAETPDYPFPEERLFRGDEVEIAQIVDDGKFVRVLCKNPDRSAVIRVKKDWKGNPLPAFKMMFAEKSQFQLTEELQFNMDKFKTKADLLKYFGFPLSICKKGNIERYYYSILFMGYNIGADELWIEIQNDKIIDYSFTI
jgi:hypothetical protein